MNFFRESIVEDSTLEWFGEQARYARTLTLPFASDHLHCAPVPRGTVGHGPRLAPDEPAAERDSFDDVVLAAKGTCRNCQRTTKIK